jgi:hypothetical protein
LPSHESDCAKPRALTTTPRGPASVQRIPFVSVRESKATRVSCASENVYTSCSPAAERVPLTRSPSAIGVPTGATGGTLPRKSTLNVYAFAVLA